MRRDDDDGVVVVVSLHSSELFASQQNGQKGGFACFNNLIQLHSPARAEEIVNRSVCFTHSSSNCHPSMIDSQRRV